MVSYEMASDELAEVRFAVSPLCEMGFSLRAWRDPGRYPLHLPWMRMAQQARDDLDTEMLLALTNERLWTPDFVTPRPRSPLTRIEDELAELSRLAVRTIGRDLRPLGDHATASAPLAGPTAQVRRRIVAALTGYWEICFAPYWPRIRAVLEADVLYRGRQMSHYGLGAMLGGLAEGVSVHGSAVQVGRSAAFPRSADGDGLTLVPSTFAECGHRPISPDVPPTIWYPARGVGTLWHRGDVQSREALARLVGRPRARLLALLGEPASSTELAVREGVSTAAVNHQLRAMQEAGWLSSARAGRSVLYRRTELGDRLVGEDAP